MGVAVVTGANRGIGLELVRQLRKRGDEVVAVCRAASDALAALGVEVVEGIDVGDDAAAPALTETFKGRTIDLLINNAGVLTSEDMLDMNFERIRRQFEVNTLGPLRVTHALQSNLVSGSKVAIISSRVGSLADNSSGGMYGYRISKTAVNMAGVNLAHDLKPRGITVVLLHPGYVKTEMTGGRGTTDAATSASGVLAQIEALGLDQAGTFWHAEGYELPW